MKTWEAPISTFNYGFNEVAYVFFNRYPNSFSKHVVSEDVIFREINEHQIKTKKLIVKKGEKIFKIAQILSAANFLKAVPSYFSSRLTSIQYMPTVEESIYDRRTLTLTTRTRNVSWNHLMNMEERCIYNYLDDEKTNIARKLFVSVNYGHLSYLAERFLLMKFKKSIRKTLEGFQEKLNEGNIKIEKSRSPNVPA